jgi:hypothetical protein
MAYDVATERGNAAFTFSPAEATENKAAVLQ